MGKSYAMFCHAVPDEDLPLVREMMAYADIDPFCNPLNRQENGMLSVGITPIGLHWSRQSEWPWAVREAELEKHHECLEVGGGGCPMKYAVAKRCRRLIAAEINVQAMQEVRWQIDNQGSDNIIQVIGDVRDLPFPEGWFDRAFCISVIEHMPEDHLLAVRELIRVLKPGGILLLTVDVAVQGAGNKGNFYLDRTGLISILKELGIEGTLDPTGPCALSYMQEENTDIAVVMIKYVKPN